MDMGLLPFVTAGADISDILQSLANALSNWGSLIVLILGIAMIIVGVYQLAKALITHGKGQPPNWLVIIGLLVLGGVLTLTSFRGVAGWFQGGDVSQILTGSVDETTEAEAGDWTRHQG